MTRMTRQLYVGMYVYMTPMSCVYIYVCTHRDLMCMHTCIYAQRPDDANDTDVEQLVHKRRDCCGLGFSFRV
jgi:hypothetical protein